MTSTDGFFATRKPDPSDIGTSLGKLTVGFGDLSVWRERLYLFEPKDNGKLKAAYHGFRGGYKDLRAIPLEPGTYEYFARQVITNKLAGRDFKTANGVRSFEPGVFATLTFSLRLDPGP